MFVWIGVNVGLPSILHTLSVYMLTYLKRFRYGLGGNTIQHLPKNINEKAVRNCVLYKLNILKLQRLC